MSNEKETKQVNVVTVENQTNSLPDQLSDEQIEFARLNLQKEFNKRYSKWAVIADEKADDAFIEECKADLEAAKRDVTERLYDLSNSEEGVGLKTAKFLLDWNCNFNKWSRGEWRGVIHFNKVINNHIEELEKNTDKPLQVDYSTLIFLYTCMKEPYGIGLETARQMGKYENYNEETDAPFETEAPVTYSGILERVFNYVREITAHDKKLNILKQRLDLAYGTARMNLNISSIEEFIEFHNEITKSAIPEDDNELKEAVAEAAQE